MEVVGNLSDLLGFAKKRRSIAGRGKLLRSQDQGRLVVLSPSKTHQKQTVTPGESNCWSELACHVLS